MTTPRTASTLVLCSSHPRPVVRTLAALSILAASLLPPGCHRHPGTLAALPIPGARALGGPGEAPGQFIKPRAIAKDATTLWVVDRSGRIQRLDPETGHCLQFFRLPATTLGFPVNVRVYPSPAGDGAPALWVPDTHFQRVLVFALPPMPTHTPGGPDAPAQEVSPPLLAQFGAAGEGPGQFIYPTDILVLTEPDGQTLNRVWVSEYGGNDRVQIFDASLKPLTAFGHFGAPGEDVARPAQAPPTGDVAFQRPQSMVYDPRSGQVIIADSVNHRLGFFTKDGAWVRWLGGNSTPGGSEPPLAAPPPASGQAPPDAPETSSVSGGTLELKHPRGLKLLDDGTLLVVEFGAARLTRVDLQTGRAIQSWGRAGRGEGELAEPWAVEVIGKRAYVVDALNHRLVTFEMDLK